MSNKPRERLKLYDPNVLDLLTDREWFVACLKQFYGRVADNWGCTIHMSERRFNDAYHYWRSDMDRTLTKGMEEGTESLDHFKQASFLSFWLRRMMPINDIYFSDDPSHELLEDRKHFSQYGSELCALLAGISICLNYEIRHSQGQFRGLHLSEKLLYEVPMILKNKNISAQGIYMMFLAMFGELSTFSGSSEN